MKPLHEKGSESKRLDVANDHCVCRGDRHTVGAHGWVMVKFDDAPLPLDVLKRWVEESHSLLATAKAGGQGNPLFKMDPHSLGDMCRLQEGSG